MLLILPAHANQQKCRYPTADGAEENPSPPSVVGTTISVSRQTIVVSEDETKRKIKIKIDNDTLMFTEFGGMVKKNELKKGHHLSVWYVGCDAKKAGSSPRAAVVEVDSVDFYGSVR